MAGKEGIRLDEQTVKAIVDEVALRVGARHKELTLKGYLIPFLTVITLLISVVVATVKVTEKINERATPDQVKETVESELIRFELRLTKEAFVPLTDKVNEIALHLQLAPAELGSIQNVVKMQEEEIARLKNKVVNLSRQLAQAGRSEQSGEKSLANKH